MPNNYYDLAISNVPFGTIRYQHGKQTYNIHNFFFAKVMDVVRSGGLGAFITGTGTMQAGQDAAVLRAMLNGQTDLIAGFRLGLEGKVLNVAEELSARMNKLPENIYKPVGCRKNHTIKNIIKYDGEKVPTYSFITQDGKIYHQKSYEVVGVPKENQPRVKDYLRLVKAVENILNEQISNPKDDKLPQLRQTLTDAYDNFVKNNGYINSAENIKILGNDPHFGMTAAIKNYREDKKAKTVTAKKGDIFYKRTLGAMVEPSTAENINDALLISIAWHGELDIDYMTKLLGKISAQVIDELGDTVFENPVTHLYELAEEYLSGNVREKLAIAEEAAKYAWSKFRLRNIA